MLKWSMQMNSQFKMAFVAVTTTAAIKRQENFDPNREIQFNGGLLMAVMG